MGYIMGSPDDDAFCTPQLFDLLTRLVRALEAVAACKQASEVNTTAFLNREERLHSGSPLVTGDWSQVPDHLRRIAEALDPPPPDVVGSPFVAQRLGCTTTWVADQVRRGVIPSNCIVPGSGNGRPWKFYRVKIDEWFTTR